VPQSSPSRTTETEKVTYVVNGLKDIALSEDVPMIAIVAADKEGLKAPACATTTCAARRPSTTRPTSS
jgi:hypothetical protein